MRVTHLNHTDAGNGAARAAYRLHKALQRDEVLSQMFVQTKKTSDPTVQSFRVRHNIWMRLRRRLRKERIQRAFAKYQDTRPEGAELFYDDRTPHYGNVLPQCPPADVFNLHSIYGFVDHNSFFQHVNRPVVWTLHDMNAFTGGCQYTAGCIRFRNACGKCPQLGSEEEKDLSRKVWERKWKAYRPKIRGNQLRIVTPSRWLADQARKSPLILDATVTVIPNAVDSDTFCPRSTEGVPSALNIPESHQIVLFLASSTERTRKGFDLFADAVEEASVGETTFISIGGGKPRLAEHLDHVHLGHIGSDQLLSVFYGMSDIFVIPSRQDNLPNTVLESMASGTPVVGFNTGGIPDMVRPGETGWLAESESIRALRGAVEQALSDEGVLERRSARCREVVEEEYTLDVQAQAYRTLYEEMIGQADKP